MVPDAFQEGQQRLRETVGTKQINLCGRFYVHPSIGSQINSLSPNIFGEQKPFSMSGPGEGDSLRDRTYAQHLEKFLGWTK